MLPATILDDMPYSELKGAYHSLEKKNRDLVDGLYYAAFVQQGLMPQARHFRKLDLPYFIYYQPLQIIGGDFFWIGKKDGWCYYAVGDCTGHGVSGAMLSSLAIGFLNYVVYSKKFDHIGDILTEIDKKWIETFNHNEDADVNNDWMEISLIAYNSESYLLHYSGAGSSIVLVSDDGSFEKVRGNNYPVGGWQIEKHRKFSTREISTSSLTNVYLYSDGMRDQFGALLNKRMGSARFNAMLAETAHLPCTEQKFVIEDLFNSWKGNNLQTDDVCLLRVDL
jgi:serine phosphatase RsbU (regulator of sigma subunit)